MDKEENKNLCTLYLVRHGETEWNKTGIVMGQLDAPLTEHGIEQVRATAQELRDIHFDAIFSSDLHRTQRTAEIIKLERKLVVQTSKALRERTYGHFEGTSGEEYRNKFKHLYEKLNQLPEKEQRKFKPADDVESDEEVISRFIVQLREICIAYANKTVLVATHGGCIRTFLMHTGYVKVLSDGVDFFVREVKGIRSEN